jgi:hypothetical protein
MPRSDIPGQGESVDSQQPCNGRNGHSLLQYPLNLRVPSGQFGVPGAFSGKYTVRGDDRLAYRIFCCENRSLELLPSLN